MLINDEKEVVSNFDQSVENNIPTSTSDPRHKEILTLRKHAIDYFTRDGVILRTGYDNIIYWYLLCLKELLDNAADSLTNHYKGTDDTQITTKIHKDDNLFRMTVRNSNYKNIKVFQDKNTIFNYEGRSGTKQGVHVISRGLLGDAMKQLLSLGYVLANLNDDGTQLTNKQWDYPLTISHNGEEWKVKLFVDKVQQNGFAISECVSRDLNHTDTEIELILPIVREARNLTRTRIEIFCKEYATLTTDITLKFKILDESTQPALIRGQNQSSLDNYTESMDTKEEDIDEDKYEESEEPTDEDIEKSIAKNIISALTTSADKAIVNLEFPALHSLSLENLNNANSVHTCSPSEFAVRIINAQHKDEINIHRFLQTYREGTQLPKTEDNQKLLSELVDDHERDNKILRYYQQLKSLLPPAKEITLPYKRKEREAALVERISKLYDIDKEQKPVYKLIHGFYDDSEPRKVWISENNRRLEEGKGIIKFPYVFEIIAVSRANPLEGEQRGKGKQTVFIGAVNYSTSPKSNVFEGEYGFLASEARNIIAVLERCGFHRYYGPTSKLPCVIVGNLITLRREPHGYDKSRIDLQPFSDTIIKACISVAKGIKTYRAAGYHFTRATNYSTARLKKTKDKETLEYYLLQLLRRDRGLKC